MNEYNFLDICIMCSPFIAFIGAYLIAHKCM